jgi:DNA-binding NarL/FixJ family response regulator
VSLLEIVPAVSGGTTAIVCDDAPGYRVLMSAVLREQGVQVTHLGASWADAEALAVTVPDIVVVDLWMPTFDEDALFLVRSHAPGSTLAVVTALEIHEAVGRVAAFDVDLVLNKSRPPDEIARTIVEHAQGLRATA